MKFDVRGKFNIRSNQNHQLIKSKRRNGFHFKHEINYGKKRSTNDISQ
jgi:hypothetical protein